MSRRRRALQLRQQYDSVTQVFFETWAKASSTYHTDVSNLRVHQGGKGTYAYVHALTRNRCALSITLNSTRYPTISHVLNRVHQRQRRPIDSKTRRGGGVPEALAIAAVWRAWYCLPWPAPYARYDCQHAETAGIHCRQIAAGNDNKHAPSAGMICR